MPVFILEQFLMGPELLHFTFAQHHNIVGVPDSTQAVGDNYGGTLGNKLLDGVLNDCLRFRVNGGRSLVEDKYILVENERSDKRDQLPLAHG